MTTARNRRRPWGRIVAGAIGAVILFLAVAALTWSHKERRAVDAALVAEPVRLKVDLSKPGQFSGEFRQTFRAACSGYLEIVPEPLPSSEKAALSLLKGLRGRLTIVRSDGRVVHECGIREEDFIAILDGYAHWVPRECDDFSFEEGIYQIKVVVDHGAPALAGVPHSLVGQYVLCGMENMPAEILYLIGIASCVIAGLILLPVALNIVIDRFSSGGARDGEEAPLTG